MQIDHKDQVMLLLRKEDSNVVVICWLWAYHSLVYGFNEMIFSYAMIFYCNIKFAQLLLQDLQIQHKYLVTFTVGHGQMKNIDTAVKKVINKIFLLCSLYNLSILNSFLR